MEQEIIFKGTFYHPSNPDETVAGIITYKPDEPIRIEFIGMLSAAKYTLYDLNFHKPVDLICGYVNGENPITILNSSLVSFSGSLFKTTHATFEAEHMIEGQVFESIDDICYEYIHIRTQFIDEWAELRGFKMDDLAPNDDKKFKVQVIYEQPEPVPLFENDRYKMYLFQSGSVPGNEFKSMLIKAETKWLIELKKEVSFSELTELIIQVKQFLILGIGFPVGIVGCELFLPNEERYGSDSLYFSYNKITRYYDSYNKRNMLFSLKEIQPNASFFLNNWFEKYNTYKTSLSYYYDVIMNYTNANPVNCFLNLVQALEIYHKRSVRSYSPETKGKYPSEYEELLELINTNNRLKSFLEGRNQNKYRTFKLNERFESILNQFELITNELISDKKTFIKKVCLTRNHLNHDIGSPSENHDIIEDANLHKYIQKLRILLQIVFMFEIGLELPVIEKRIKKALPNFMHFENA